MADKEGADVGSNSNRNDENESPRASLSSHNSPSSSTAPSVSERNNGCGNDSQASRRSFFECSICFDVASEPVVTPCGHLFCWPCLFAWMERKGDPFACPVCKASVTESEIVPLYARDENTEGKKRGESNAPPRPRPRPATQESHHPHSHEHAGGFEFDAGPHFQMHMFGAPFGLGMGMFGFGPTIGFQTQWPPAPRHRQGHGRPPPREPQHLTEEQQRAQMQVFLVIFVLILFFSILL